MKNNLNNLKKEKTIPYKIDSYGSLGLLAYGDKGLRAWRKARKESAEDKSISIKK